MIRQALDEVAACGDLAALEDARVRWLGKKGRIPELLKSAGKLVASAGPEAVARVQKARADLEVAIVARRAEISRADIERKLVAERMDVTLPGRGEEPGGLHPVTKTRLRIETLFRQADRKSTRLNSSH